MRDFYSRNKYMKEADVEISAFLKYINTKLQQTILQKN